MAHINIAFGITENWIKYTCVTITSVLSTRNKDDFYTFYIMCDNNSFQIK